MEENYKFIEALIFCASTPISITQIQKSLEEASDIIVNRGIIEKGLDYLINKYEDEQYSFQIFNINDAYCFKTKVVYKHHVNTLTKIQSKRKLSNSALETIAIIAYQQPTTKAEIEKIRGVNSDYAVKRLLEKGLIEIKGKSEMIGKPLLYGTSDFFMEYFGLKNIKDLPKHLETEKEPNKIGLEQEH